MTNPSPFRLANKPFPSGLSFIVMDLAPLKPTEQVLISALQGIVALTGSLQQIFTIDSNCAPYSTDASLLWLKETGIQHTAATGVQNLIRELEGYLVGYILYDQQNNPDSLNIATSLAGVKAAVPVDVSIESETAGLAKVLDVSKMTYDQFWSSHQGDMSTNLAVELDPIPGDSQPTVYSGPRDFAAKSRAAVFYGNTGSPLGARDRVMRHLVEPAPIFGWGPTDSMGEYAFIKDVGGNGGFYVAANWARNLSVLSSLAVEPKPVPAPRPRPVYTPGKRYVAFIMSDGDNLQWILNRGNDPQWWGSTVRGTLPIGWTIPPALYYLAPTVWNYLVRTSTGEDGFVVGPSGIGYRFGNVSDNPKAFSDQCACLNAFMRDSGVQTVSIFGYDNWNTTEYWQPYLEQAAVAGAFYFEYDNWIMAESNYCTQWHNGKPLIPANEYLGTFQDHTEEESKATVLADLCAASPKNSGIFAVYVDAWATDGSGSKNNPMELMRDLWTSVQEQCGDTVELVTPGELVQLAILAKGSG